MTSRSHTSPDLMIGRTVGTHYVLSKLLGRGLRSATYLAEHRSLHRDVVVKLLDNPWGSDTAAASRFDQAARSLSTLEAPNIAALIDSGRDPGRGLFVVTEFIEGDSLETFLGDRGALSLEEFVPLAAQILKGLGAAHLRGLLHLDITLDNIYLSRDDADPSRGLVRLLDLGLVQLVEGHVQGHVQGLEAPTTGDTRYLAPEQISNKPLDTRTDVYALGALFYQMLAGLPPFNGTDAQIIYKHVNEVPPSLAEQVDDPLPSELIELIEQCLKKDPNDRPVDANEIVELLIDSVPAALFRGYVPPPKAVVAAAAAAAAVASAGTAGADDDGDTEDLSDALVDDDEDDDIANPATSADARVAAPLIGEGLTETQDEQRPEPVDPSKRKPSIGDLSISEPKSSSNSWTVSDEAVTSASGASLTVDEPVATPIEEKKGGGTGFFVLLLLVGVAVGVIFVLKPELLGLGPKPVQQQPAALPPATTTPAQAPIEDVPTLLAKARTLEADGDMVGASAVYHQILAEDPTHEEATARLAALTGADSDAATTGTTTGTTGADADTDTDAGTTTGDDGTDTDAGETTGTTGDETTGTTTGGDEVAAGKIRVEFDVKPRGTLYVDGKKLGKVPGTLSLPLGKHTLKIDGGSRHKVWEETVVVTDGMAPMEVKLKRKPKDLSGENIDIDPMAEGPATEFKFKK